MEPNNLPVMAKKFWSIMRAAFYMMKQGICKRKLMLDLNLMLQRGKIAGKAAIHNLMFHHHVSVFAAAAHRRSSFPAPPTNEYEFSCSNSPAHKKTKHSLHFPCAHAPATDDGVLTVKSFMKALEMHNNMVQSETASPALPGFGRTPLARQLRVTDSPFSLIDGEGDCHVDEAADEFISKFYNDLRLQSN